MNIVIPMAGLGSRFPQEIYKVPKPMIEIGNTGKSMIQCAIESLGFHGKYYFIINEELITKYDINSVLKSFMVDPYELIPINYVTEGPACSALLAKKYINNDDPLVITNCDQIMEWGEHHDFIKFATESKADAAVVTYPSITEKNSYVQLNFKNEGVKFAEKKVISKYSLNGIHYWKKGSDFIKSAEIMIFRNLRVNNEFYIAPTFNEMLVEDKIIIVYHIGIPRHWAVGTPEDLNKYLEHRKFIEECKSTN